MKTDENLLLTLLRDIKFQQIIYKKLEKKDLQLDKSRAHTL